MHDDDNIIVNDFMFCKPHGDEHCYSCTVDHRFTNNYQIQDQLDDFSEVIDFNLDDRTSINVYEHGASRSGRHACTSHKRVDCSKCFDWKSIVGAEIQEAVNRQAWLEKRKKWLDRVDP